MPDSFVHQNLQVALKHDDWAILGDDARAKMSEQGVRMRERFFARSWGDKASDAAREVLRGSSDGSKNSIKDMALAGARLIEV